MRVQLKRTTAPAGQRRRAPCQSIRAKRRVGRRGRPRRIGRAALRVGRQASALTLSLVLLCSSFLTGLGPWAAATAYAESRPAGPGVTTIDQALGCTRTVEEVLLAHASDSYYLGTSYGNTGPNGAGGPVSSWSCRYPNGRPNPANGLSYMNCAGFVSAVITDAGGDVSPIANYESPVSGYNRGNDTNASKWQGWVHWNAVEMYDFASKDEMLASGILERGDIIYIHPQTFEGDDDCHIGFFWGSTSSEDLFWHSSSHGDSIIAGNAPGNMISRITPKSDAAYYRVIKVVHDVEVTFQKTNALPAVDTTGSFYALAGATYDIHRDDDDSLAGTITTDSHGRATLTLDANTAYYAIETKAPDGWTLNPSRIEFDTGDTTTVTLPETPKPPVTFQKVSSAPDVDTSDDYYSFEGATYQIYRASDDACVGTIATDAQGRATLHLDANTDYYAIETEAPAGFVLNPARISFNSGAGTTVALPDAPRVTVTFTKTSAHATITDGNQNYAYSGATYEIRRASDDALVDTITTDAQGRAELKLDPHERYYAVETAAPQGFIPSTERHEFETGSADSTEQLLDVPGTVTLRLQKRDATTGSGAQRGASLEGARYRVVDANGVTHDIVTDAMGYASIDDLPFGSITVTETAAPAGYQLDTTVHTYKVSPSDMPASGIVELAPTDNFVETPVAFDLAIVKYIDSGEEGSGLQEAAEGVRFEIISNTTGAVVGSITTDNAGNATTTGRWFGDGERTEGVRGALPWDAAGYTVREDPATTPDGYQSAPDWRITPEQMVDGATLHYIVDNDFVSSRIQVVKVDAETGRTVPAAGFTFQVLNEDGDVLSQEAWYPNHVELTEFTTDERGMVTFPGALKPGTYYVREVAVGAAPYLLNEHTVEVTIEETADLAPLTVVHMADDQARGQATITKRCTTPDGEDGTHVHDEGCTGTLAGAEFDVIAMEDIVSPDGSVCAVAGEIVDHVATGADGVALTDELYLGTGSATYAFVETLAPTGHVLDSTPHEFTLSYVDDVTPVVTAEVEVSDEPTETTLEKSVLGHDDPLPGAAFLLWEAAAEHALTPEAGCAALAVDAAENKEVSIRRVCDHAELAVAAPDDWTVELTCEEHEYRIAGDYTALAPASYTVSVYDGTGAAIALPDDAVIELEANHRYELTIAGSFFFGTHCNLHEKGDIEPTIVVPWDRERGAHVFTDLEPGSYFVSTRDRETALQLDPGASTVLDEALSELPALIDDDAPAITLTTDEAGTLTLRHLAEGSYRLWESDAPDGFLTDGSVHYFTVDRNGLTEGFTRYELAVKDDYTKVDISKRSVSHEDELPGAHLAVRDAEGNTVEEWISSDEEHRIEALEPGDYTLVELKTPHDHDEAQEILFTVHETGEVQRVVLYDEPIQVTGALDKRQEIADPTHPYTDAGTTVEEGGVNNAPAIESEDGSFAYRIDLRNTSSTWVDEFTVTDELHTAANGLAELTGLTTPVATEDFDGLMNVWYRTDQTSDDYTDPSNANATRSDGHENPWLDDEATAPRLGNDGRVVDYTGWRLWAADIPTTEARQLSVSDLNLSAGEDVIALRFEYGRVEEGFTSREEDWERDLLKDAHDDVASATAGPSDTSERNLRERVEVNFEHTGTWETVETGRTEHADGSWIEISLTPNDDGTWLYTTSRGHEGDTTIDDISTIALHADQVRTASFQLAPAIVYMRVTDAYRAGTTLENSALLQLYRNGGSLDEHERLEDEDEDFVQQEPVERTPLIGTTFADAVSGVHDIEPGTVSLIDTVSYQGIEPGIEHVLQGTLMDGATGEPVLDADGAPLTVETSFIPEASDGLAQVPFDFDATALAGHELVAFEELFYRLDTSHDQEQPASEAHGAQEEALIPVAEHKDLDDEGQTVFIKQPEPPTPEPSPDAPEDKHAEPLAQTGVDRPFALLATIACIVTIMLVIVCIRAHAKHERPRP